VDTVGMVDMVDTEEKVYLLISHILLYKLPCGLELTYSNVFNILGGGGGYGGYGGE